MKRYVRKLELDTVRRAKLKSKSASEASLDLSIDPLIVTSLEVVPSRNVVTPTPSTESALTDDPRRKWRYESRPTKRRWDRDVQSRSPSPGSSSREPDPSEDDFVVVPVKRTKQRVLSPVKPDKLPASTASAPKQLPPSEPREPAEVAKAFMAVMQEQLSSLVQAFSCPPSQSIRCKDVSLPVKRSSSKREQSISPKKPLRTSSAVRQCTPSSSVRRQDVSSSRSRRQDDTASRSRRQDDSASRSKLQDDSASRFRKQDKCSLHYQDDTASRHQDDTSSRRQDDSSARRQDDTYARRQDDTYAQRQDANNSRCQAACSPLLQDVDLDQDLDDILEEEEKPTDSASDYKVLSPSLLELYGVEFQPSAPRSPQSQFIRKKATKHSAFIKMKLSILARKALAKVGD
ncbi:micronuclear linker histone polyprotein-like [Palaemon carinicauda]|uniref:micronuclear linker histone polyprotein-like n=1 Tax=Palaemon carinicauda TaxID=392227 RepID=UPI0035B6A527